MARLSPLVRQPRSTERERNSVSVPAAISITIDQIRLPRWHRAVDYATVQGLADSIGMVGLQNPITVARSEDGDCVLYAGRHRLEACIRLGFKTIKARVVDQHAARLLKSSENLHRLELKGLDRDAAIASFAKERKRFLKRQLSKGGRQPHDRGNSAIGRDLHIDRKQVREAIYRAENIDKEVKRYLKLNGLDCNVGLLNAIAKRSTVPEQLALATRSVQQKKVKPKKVRKNTQEDEISNSLVRASLSRLQRDWQESSFRKRFEEVSDTTRNIFLKRLRTENYD